LNIFALSGSKSCDSLLKVSGNSNSCAHILTSWKSDGTARHPQNTVNIVQRQLA